MAIAKAFDMWLACATQEEIAAAVEMTRQAIATWEDDFAKSSASEDFANSRDFDPPIYNVWKLNPLHPRARNGFVKI